MAIIIDKLTIPYYYNINLGRGVAALCYHPYLFLFSCYPYTSRAHNVFFITCCSDEHKWYLQVYFHFALGLLEKSDLDLVTEELGGVSTKWYTLGNDFGLDSNELDSIRMKMSPNHKVCLKEMLNHWMEHFNITTTWSTVVAGLRTSVDSQLADHLEAKYCSSELINL